MYKHSTFEIETVANRPSYHNITLEIEKTVQCNDVKNGLVVISTPHTTCSLFYDEVMHDVNYYGDDLLHVDINNIMEKIAPQMKTENDYNSPGPKHIEFGLNLSDPNYPSEKWVMLNTDAHLRASIYGSNSLTFIVKDGQLLTGKLGEVFFVDWDQLRTRQRTINILLLGE